MINRSSSEFSHDTPLTLEDTSQLFEVLRPIRKRSRVGAVVLAATVALGSVLPADIAIGKTNVEHSVPTIHSISDMTTERPNDDPLVYMDGFARQDSRWQATNMLPALQVLTDSEISALEYGEKGIDINAIASTIASELERQGATSISLYGYSIGGDVALLVAGVLIHKYGIRVTNIYLDHSPASIDDINPAQRELATNVINGLGFFEDLGLELQYSSIAREIVNQAIPESNSYMDQVSSSLLIDQYSLGASVDTEQAIARLQSDTLPTPGIIYISSKSDTVINLTQADATFQHETADANVPYLSLSVDGTVHGRPDYAIDSYMSVFTESEPMIEQQSKTSEALYRMQTGLHIDMRVQFNR